MARSRTRLSKLEAITQSDTAVNWQPMLCEVLGRRDALFWPRRADPNLSLSVLQDRRRDCLRGHYGVSARASGRTDWISSMEVRNQIISRGYAVGIKTSGGEVSGLAITPTGEAMARALIGGLATLATRETQLIFHYLRLREATLKGPIAESLLFQRPLFGDPTSWNHLTELVLPLLTAGLMESRFDGVGRAYYQLVSNELPQAVECDQAEVAGMHDCYIAAFNAELHILDTLEGDGGLTMPLSCGMGFDSFKPDEDDSDFEQKRFYIAQIESILGKFGPFTPTAFSIGYLDDTDEDEENE